MFPYDCVSRTYPVHCWFFFERSIADYIFLVDSPRAGKPRGGICPSHCPSSPHSSDKPDVNETEDTLPCGCFMFRMFRHLFIYYSSFLAFIEILIGNLLKYFESVAVFSSYGYPWLIRNFRSMPWLNVGSGWMALFKLHISGMLQPWFLITIIITIFSNNLHSYVFSL